MLADAGGVMSIGSCCEKVLDVVDNGRMGIFLCPWWFELEPKGFRGRGSSVRLIASLD
jgi:hypothetical protein